MIEVAVTAEIEEEAWDRASDMPFLSGSITNGTSNVVGCLGEILVQRHLHAKFSNTFNYDLIDGEMRVASDVKYKHDGANYQFLFPANFEILELVKELRKF